MKLGSVLIVALAASFGAAAATAAALKWDNVFDAIKTVQETATLEYRPTSGNAQSIPIEPGIYKISIQKLRR